MVSQDSNYNLSVIGGGDSIANRAQSIARIAESTASTASSEADLAIKSAPSSGEHKVYNIVKDGLGDVLIDWDDVPEP